MNDEDDSGPGSALLNALALLIALALLAFVAYDVFTGVAK